MPSNSLYQDSWRYTSQFNSSSGANPTEQYAITVQSVGNMYLQYPVIIDTWLLQHEERVQVLEAFNDVIHVYAYGRRPGQLGLQGYLLADSDSNQKHRNATKYVVTPYFKNLRAYVSANTGDLVSVTGPGDLGLFGTVTRFSLSCQAQQDNVMRFTMQFIVLSQHGDGSTTDS